MWIYCKYDLGAEQKLAHSKKKDKLSIGANEVIGEYGKRERIPNRQKDNQIIKQIKKDAEKRTGRKM